MTYIGRVWISIDQLVNAILGGNADETISSRCWRNNWGYAVKVINYIIFWQNNHCRGAYAKNLERKAAPLE